MKLSCVSRKKVVIEKVEFGNLHCSLEGLPMKAMGRVPKVGAVWKIL